MYRIRTMALILLGAALAGPSIADASRPATPDEIAGVEQGLRLKPGCAEIRLSTATTGNERYALVRRIISTGCEFYASEVVARDPGTGGWQSYYEADEDQERPYCEDRDVRIPAAVARDLDLRGVCRHQLRRTHVWSFGGLKIKPSRMPDGARSYIKRVRWTSWTRTSASASGRFDYADREIQIDVPVRLRFYRPVICDDGQRVFTRRKMTAVHPRDRKRIKIWTEDRTFGGCFHESE